MLFCNMKKQYDYFLLKYISGFGYIKIKTSVIQFVLLFLFYLLFFLLKECKIYQLERVHFILARSGLDMVRLLFRFDRDLIPCVFIVWIFKILILLCMTSHAYRRLVWLRLIIHRFQQPS